MEGKVDGEIDKEKEEYKEYDEKDEEEEDGEEEEREEKEEEEREEADGGGEREAVGSGLSGNDYRPFILFSIWSVNDFLSKM